MLYKADIIQVNVTILNETFCKDSGLRPETMERRTEIMQMASHYIHFGQYTNDYSGVGRMQCFLSIPGGSCNCCQMS